MVAELLKNGGKIIKQPKGGFKGPTKAGTPANVAKAIKDLKKSNTGAGRPSPKKGSNVKKKNETIASGQQGPGGVTVRPPSAPKKPATQQGPGGVTVRPPGGKPPTASRTAPKKPTKPRVPKKDPKSPFAKETKAQTAARIKKEKIAAQRIKDNNKQNPSRDPRGKYQRRPLKPTNIPKTGGAKKGGLKSRLDAKAKRAAMGVGVAAVKVDNLSRGEIEIGPRKDIKVTPKTGQGRPSMDKNKNKRKIPVVKPKKGPMKVSPKVTPKTGQGRPSMDKNKNKGMTFGQAFNDARTKKKEPTFSWRNPKTGKTGKYTTRLKEESIADHKKKFGVTGKY